MLLLKPISEALKRVRPEMKCLLPFVDQDASCDDESCVVPFRLLTRQSCEEGMRREGPDLLEAVGESMPHARPPKARGPHVQDMVGLRHFMPEIVLQVGVLRAPHKLIDVQIDHPVGHVAVLGCAVLGIQTTAQCIALILGLASFHAEVITPMLPAKSLIQLKCIPVTNQPNVLLKSFHAVIWV